MIYVSDIELSWPEAPTPTPTPTPTPAPQTLTVSGPGAAQAAAPASALNNGAYAALVLEGDPVAFWRLGEASGDAIDSTGHGHTGTRIGSPLCAQAGAHPIDGAKSQDFDGTDDYIQADAAQLIGGVNMADDFSIVCWGQFDAIGGPIFAQSSTGHASRNYIQCYQYLAGYTFEAVDNVDAVAYVDETSANRADGLWHQVVFVHDGNTLLIYLDGSVLQSKSVTWPSSWSLGAQSVTIGTRRTSGGHTDHPNGRLQDVAIYTRALSDTEVLALYEAAVPPPQTLVTLGVSAFGRAPSVALTLGAEPTPAPQGPDPDAFTDSAPVADPDAFTDSVPALDPDTVPSSELEVSCLMTTTGLVNIALSRIGVSKQITSYSTDTSKEASVARLHWGFDVNRTLRDYPWAFATKYHTLECVAGNETHAVNGDWQYAYAVPTDCVMARRIVPTSGAKRAYDENPIVFKLGMNTDGEQVLYCDEVEVQLEYTARVACPAAAPDAHFRSALAWRLAASLVSPLARDRNLIAYCEAMCRSELALAGATQGNEQQQPKDGDAAWIGAR